MLGRTEREDEEARYFSADQDRDRRRLDRLLEATVQSVVTLRTPAFVPADASVRTAARHMAASDVGAVLVTGPESRLVGVLSERDILVHVTVPGADPDRVRVASCMSRVRISIGPRTTVAEALHLLVGRRRTGNLPVLDRAGEPVGCLSARDLAACLVDGVPRHVGRRTALGGPAVALAAEGA